jgi:hypothetical protein
MKTRLFLIIFLINATAFAQVTEYDSQYSVKTKLSKETILLGDRVELDISVLVPETCKVTFPSLSDSLMKGIELVKKPTTETKKLKDKKNEQVLKLLITSFDSGSYQLPELKIAVYDGTKTDTILSKPLTLVVNSIPRDKAVKDIIDIKPPIEEPLTVGEVAPFAFGGILFAALLFLLFIYLKRRRENRPFSFLQKHVDPPHIVALRELERIKQEKLWLSENHKYYYTRLIDTLRIYIEGRYEVKAMEQTTDEILFGLKQVGFPVDDLYTQLQEALTLADLVKFAKYTPFVSDNEQNLKVAFDFVERTKPLEEVKETAKIEENNSEKIEETVELSNDQDNKMLS